MQVISGKQVKAQRVIVYGPEGIGKSTMGSKFPNPIFIDTEGSTAELNVNRLQTPNSWTMLKQQIQWASNQGYQTIVIDTIDWAERLCIMHICASRGIESLGGGKDYGKSYNLLAQEWGGLLNYLTDITSKGINVVLLAHAQMKRTDLPNEMDSYDRWELKLEKKTSALSKEWADMVLFVNYKTIVIENEDGKPKAQGGKRMMYTSHHPCWDAKNRVGMPEECTLDYANIEKYIPTIATAQPQQQPQTQSTPKTQDTKKKEVKPPVQAKQPPHPQNKPVVEYDEERAAIQAECINNQQLADLMALDGITEIQIRKVVSGKGIYPFEMDINDYEDKFINGMLVANWGKVTAEIKQKGIV